MKLKSLLFSMSVMATAPVFAATYYVTPEGAGSKDGSSWDNAFDTAKFVAQVKNNKDKDEYFFGAGTYVPAGQMVFPDNTSAVLHGSTDGRTIFSGDRNGDGTPNTGDADRFFAFRTGTADGNTSRPVIVDNIDFTGLYTNISSSSTEYNRGALGFDNSGSVVISNCNFFGNVAVGEMGGTCVNSNRSTVTLKNCRFYNNTGKARGAAIRLYAAATSNYTNKGVTTIESCVFDNNTIAGENGGAIIMQHGKSLTIVNSTFTRNSAGSNGAALFFNGKNDTFPCKVRIISSTFAGNTITGDATDAQITSTQQADISIANSIITCDDMVAAIKFNTNSTTGNFAFVSGGYNFVGEIIGAPAEIAWLDSDNHGDDCTYTAIFGDNTLNSDNVIIPANFYLGATAKQVSEAVATWGLPADLDLAVDQLGNERTGEVTPGAYAYEKPDNTTGIEDITGDTQAARLVSLGANLYQIEGYEGAVTVYNISGLNIMTTNDSSIDLNSMAAGLYIIKAGNTIFKVTK